MDNHGQRLVSRHRREGEDGAIQNVACPNREVYVRLCRSVTW
jgi:hypothetical protein